MSITVKTYYLEITQNYVIALLHITYLTNSCYVAALGCKTNGEILI